MKIRFLLTAFAVLAIGTVAQATLITSFETGIGDWGSEANITVTTTSTAPAGAITDGLQALKIVDTHPTGFHLLSKPDIDLPTLMSGVYDAIELDVYLESAIADYRVLLNTNVDDVLVNTGGLAVGAHHISIPLAPTDVFSGFAQLQFITNGPATGTSYIDNVQFTTSAVPEAATFSLFGLGAVVAWSRRRRR